MMVSGENVCKCNSLPRVLYIWTPLGSLCQSNPYLFVFSIKHTYRGGEDTHSTGGTRGRMSRRRIRNGNPYQIHLVIYCPLIEEEEEEGGGWEQQQYLLFHRRNHLQDCSMASTPKSFNNWLTFSLTVCRVMRRGEVVLTAAVEVPPSSDAVSLFFFSQATNTCMVREIRYYSAMLFFRE